MSKKWPEFVTKDLETTEEGDKERLRRWEEYDREMKALIAKGGVHQDDDGWWIETATGALIGPDPEIERPLTEEELSNLVIVRRGRPPLENPKVATSIRLDADLLDALKADGRGWQTRANDLLRQAMGLK